MKTLRLEKLSLSEKSDRSATQKSVASVTETFRTIIAEFASNSGDVVYANEVVAELHRRVNKANADAGCSYVIDKQQCYVRLNHFAKRSWFIAHIDVAYHNDRKVLIRK